MLLAHKIELRPTEEQKEYLDRDLNAAITLNKYGRDPCQRDLKRT